MGKKHATVTFLTESEGYYKVDLPCYDEYPWWTEWCYKGFHIDYEDGVKEALPELVEWEENAPDYLDDEEDYLNTVNRFLMKYAEKENRND